MAKLKNIANETLFNSQLFNVIAIDENAVISAINAGCSAAFELNSDDVCGCGIKEIVHPEDRCRFDVLSSHLKYDSCIINCARVGSEKGGWFMTELKFCPVEEDSKKVGYVVHLSKVSNQIFEKTHFEDGVDIDDKDMKEEFLCNVFHGIQDAILIHDINGNVLSYNNKAINLLGLTYKGMENIKHFKDFTPAGFNAKAGYNYFSNAVEGEDQSFSWQVTKFDEDLILDVEVFLTKINRMGEEVVLSSIRDVTDRKKIEDELRNSENRYRQLVEHSPDGISIHKGGVVKYVNAELVRILGGEEPEDILGREVVDFFPHSVREFMLERIKSLYENLEPIPTVEGRMVRVDGSIVDVEFTSLPFHLDGGTAVQAVIRDITEKKKQEAYIRYLAMHDTLTGLPNRELLSDRIEGAIERRKRDDKLNALMYIDLDGFKPVNDTLGHDAGDDALREIAARLEHAVRAVDTAARIGGDEFVVLLEGVDDKSEISIVAERIIKSINEPIIICNHQFHVGASIGISTYPDDAVTSAELVTYSDKAMYHVKDHGKNNYIFYSELPY